MVMSSHQIGAMASQQQAMFGNFQSYAQQITPVYGAGPGMGAIRPPVTGGYHAGPPPMMQPPPPPMPGWSPGYGGGMGSMAMGAMMNPNAGFQGAMGEQMAGSFLGGLSTVGAGAARVAGYGSMAAGGLSMLGVGGMGMMAAGGLPGMLAVGGLEAGAYGAQQLYGGFQERQNVNRVLRQRFGGMMGIGGGRGGTGFNTQEMGQISTMVRDMSNEDMFTSTGELTRLMDRTAGMGLYRGVQDAKQFQTKFRQLTSTLREIAQTLNTSLEGATQFMDQARSQGFFSGRDISSTLSQTRMAAGASGMSMDQLMAIRSQGTQMGRMMGMRGRQGATAMMNMATNIGVGMQTGAISDELISEATGGLQGAEGAQAAAGMLMQSNARWMRRGAGRVMLAGLWDPNTGGINMERLQQAMGGGTSFQQIRTMGRANVAASGGRSSEFFANEERIAGSLQETGLAGAVQFGMLEQHIQRARGIGGDDPLGERFIRRHTGWDQSTFELQREMYRNMPRTLEDRRLREAQSTETSARTQAMEGRGVGGAQRRLQHWWETSVTNPVRQAGDDLVTSFTTRVDEAFAQMEGTVKTTVSERTKNLLAEYAEAGGRKGMAGGGRDLMTFQRFQELRSGLKLDYDEGGILGNIGRGLGIRAPKVSQQLENMNAYGGRMGLSRKSSMEEKVDFLNQANEQMKMTGADFGFTGEQMSSMGARARQIFMSEIGTGQPLRAFRERRAQFANMSGRERESFMMQRWSMYQQDPELGPMLAKAKTQAQKYAIMREIEGEGKLGEGSMPIGEMGGGLMNYETLQAQLKAAGAEEQRVVNKLAGNLIGSGYGTDWVYQTSKVMEKGTGWLGFGAKYKEVQKKIVGRERIESIRLAESMATEGGYTPSSIEEKGSVVRRYASALITALGSDTTRDLMIRAAEGDKTALGELQSLSLLKAEDAAKQGISDVESLGMLTQRIAKGDASVTEAIGTLSESTNLTEMLSVSERVKETGRMLTRSLRDNSSIVEAAGKVGPNTMSSLRAIADAQSSGNWEEADRLRRQFYSDFVGKEGAEQLAGALSADPSGASLGVGMQRASRMERELTGRQGNDAAMRGMLGEAGLEVSAFGGEAFQKLGGSQRRRMQALMTKMKSGQMTPEQLQQYFTEEARGQVGAMGVGKFGQEVSPWISAMKGGIDATEARNLAIGEGADTAERGSMAGAPETRQTLAEKQVDILTQMLKLQVAQATKDAGLIQQQTDALVKAFKVTINTTSPSGGAAEITDDSNTWK